MTKLTLDQSIAYAAKIVNEDVFGTVENAAWVMDGATGIAKDTIPGADSDPAWLVQTLGQELEAGWDTAQSTPDLFREATERTIARYSAALPNAPNLIDRPSVCLAYVRLTDGMLEIGRLHDCGVLHSSRGETRVYGCVGNPEAAAAPRAERARLLATGMPQTEFHERLLPFEREFRAKANIDGGYSIVDLTTRWIDRIERHFVPARPGDRLLLLTDGFYRLVDVFGKYDPAGLVEAAHSNGLAALYTELRELEKEDTLCTLFPRAKISDDVAAALLTVG